MSRATLERKLSVKQLAECWGWPIQKIYRLINHPDPTKRLPHVRLGGQIFFELPELERELEKRRKRALEEEAVLTRRGARSREEECAALGIDPDHEFA